MPKAKSADPIVTDALIPEIVKFIRRKDYIFKKELVHSACEKTILLRDQTIDELFVCKKFSPRLTEHKQELFSNFLREIKLLYLLNHKNIVRIFSYYIYEDNYLDILLWNTLMGWILTPTYLLIRKM